MERSFLIPALCFLVAMTGCIGANLASFLILNQVNQSRPAHEQIAWWDRSFFFKIWQSHRVMSPDSPLRKYVVVSVLLMIVGLFVAFITLPAASSANAR